MLINVRYKMFSSRVFNLTHVYSITKSLERLPRLIVPPSVIFGQDYTVSLVRQWWSICLC